MNNVPKTNAGPKCDMTPRACTKVQYATERYALMAGHAINKKYSKNTIDISAYFCPNCGFWHFTRQRHKLLTAIDQKDAEIKSLKTEIAYLKGQIKQIETQKLNHERNELLKHKIFDDLKRNNAELNKTNGRLRKDNHDLITRLNAKINESKSKVI